MSRHINTYYSRETGELIEAIKASPASIDALLEWARSLNFPAQYDKGSEIFYIGQTMVEMGDYIVKTSDGALGIMSADAFKDIYKSRASIDDRRAVAWRYRSPSSASWAYTANITLAMGYHDRGDIVEPLFEQSNAVHEIRYLPAVGQTIAQMRRHASKSNLYNRGDMKLVWLSEGDLHMLEEDQVPEPAKGQPGVSDMHEVAEGETLMSIIQSHYEVPDGAFDWALEYIVLVVGANDLKTPILRTGQIIKLPELVHGA